MFNLDISTLLAHAFVLLTAFSIHEFAHALTADYFGDETPRMHGRLTLNPLSHLDPIGSLMLLVAGFGWAKPVPMLVSLAGPLSNLLMAIVVAIPFRIGLLSVNDAIMGIVTSGSHILPTLPQLLYTFIYINLLLMLFNLIPIPPLDGDKIARYFFPPSWNRVLDQIRPYGPLILLAVVFLGFLGNIISAPLSFLMQVLVG
jgi:Zn-dependent protease